MIQKIVVGYLIFGHAKSSCFILFKPLHLFSEMESTFITIKEIRLFFVWGLGTYSCRLRI